MDRERWVVFDFDGTMVDSRAVFLALYNQVAAKNGFVPVAPADVERLRALSMRERSRILRVPLYRLPFLALEFYSLYRPRLPELELVEGMHLLLRSLKHRGFSLAILSSNAKVNITDFLQTNDLGFFNEVCCSPNIFGKHLLIRRFMRQRKLIPSQLLYVGDEVRDIEACRRVGVPVVWVGWGYDLPEQAQAAHPDWLVYHPQEILDLLPA